MKVLAVSERIIRGTRGTRTAIPAFDQIMAEERGRLRLPKSCSSRQKAPRKLQSQSRFGRHYVSSRTDTDSLTPDLSRLGASTLCERRADANRQDGSPSQREGRALRHPSLEKIEQPLTDRQQTQTTGRENDRANKWLFAQRSEGTFFEAVDLRDEFIKHLLSFGVFVARRSEDF